MKELDCVRLLEDYRELKMGTEGTIVLKHNNENYEVEFFDDNGCTIGVYTISVDKLELINNIY